jgi:hypothetical protein
MSRPSRTAYQFTLTLEANERLDQLVDAGFAPNRSFVLEKLILGTSAQSPSPSPKRKGAWVDGSWEEHRDRILEQDKKPSTTGHIIRITGQGSYEDEYKACKAAFGDGTSSFAALDVEDRKLIAGTGGGSNGFFGNMRPAAPFRPVVEKPAGAAKIAAFLDRIPLDKKEQVPIDDLRGVLTGLVSIPGLGLGTATRLLAVKRPDLFLPVNGANIRHICARIRRVRADSPVHRVGDYIDLMAVIWETTWFLSDSPPKGTDNRWIWFARVAMLDALLYAVE